MKELNHMSRRIYYIVTIMLIILMIMGLLIDNLPSPGKFDLGFFFHFVLVIILSVVLLIYPRFETRIFRTIIVIIISIYLYTIFFLYPETLSLFVFLCIIPAFSILFFDSLLFYFSLIFNGLLITFTFCYIILFDKSNDYLYIKTDLINSIINFLAIQLIIFFIFYLSYNRIKKQKLYYEQIQQSERLKTMGQLTAAVAHEIRNPLTVVKGFLQFYQGDQSFSDDVKRNFSLMIDELKTAETIISQFLMIAKPSNNQKTEKIDVKAALQSITDLLRTFGLLHHNTIDLIVEDHCYISVNIIEFKQLIINFVKNAIEASNKGDSVIVKVARKGDYVEIKIIDQGCGMSKEELRTLGTPFYTLKSNGTGLGLMICFNIVEKYKGTLNFSSLKGEGTTVTLMLPIYSNDASKFV